MRKENKLDFTKCGVQLFVSNPVGNLPAVLLSSFYLIHRRIRHLKQSGKFFISCGIEHGANTHTEGILGKGQHNAFRPTAQQSIQQAGQLLFLNIRQENQEFIPAEPAAKAVRRHGIPNARRHLMNNPITKDKLIVDPKVEKIVVRIFQECIAGSSASQIAKGLNDDGISSPAKYKHRKGALYNGRIVDEASIWTASTVLRILKDERYTGKMISHTRETDGITVGKMVAMPREAWIVVPDTHEAIVSQDIFDAAAATRLGRIKTVNANTSGYKPENLFVCGYCGRKLAKAYGTVTHFYCLKARVYSDCSCAVIHEPIEDMQKQVLKVVNMMARILVERVAEIKADNAQEMPSVEKKIAEAQTHLQRLQAGKLDLYEDYRQGKITRDKFISIQKSRQQEADRLHSSLALLKGRLELLRKKAERMDRLVSDAKAIQMLPDYRPDVIRRLVQCVRVYGAGRIEIDLLENDDDLVEILESVKSMAV